MTTSARTSDLILPAGLTAVRPDPTTVPAGSLYPSTDDQTIYRNNDVGDTWEPWLVIGDITSYVNAEEVRDLVAGFLKPGPGVSLSHNDPLDELTIGVATDAEVVRDTIAAALQPGTGVTITVDDPGNTITIGVTSAVDAEVIRDTIGAALVAGTGVTLNVDDAANTITINASAAGLDAEAVRDTIGAALQAGTGTTVVVNDAGDTITVAADPEFIRDTIGATLVAGSGVTLTVNDAGDTITVAASGGGGGASNLDGLTDVDTSTTPPTDGQVLVYNATTGLWKPGKGGPDVGAWENNIQSAFTYQTPVETDLQANPIANLGTVKPAAATIEVTVTADMLLANTGGDVKYRTAIQLQLLGRCVGSSGNLEYEMGHLNASTGVEFTSGGIAGGPSTGNRFNVSVLSPPVAVGDKVRLRLWGGNAANWRVDWWARRSVPTRIGYGTDNLGRIALVRDLVVTGTLGYFVPSTTLTLGGTGALNTWVNGQELTRVQYIDAGAVISQNAVLPQARVALADANLGFATLADGANGTAYTAAVVNASNAPIAGFPNVPTQYRFDRLYVPAAP